MIPKLPFGLTGHDSTRTLFGGAAFKKDSGPEAAERALAILLEHGVNHIDTARSYGGGNAETLIGTWMGAHRDTFFLATKTGERTREGAEKELATSFEQLQTDRIDLIQMHGLTDEEDWATAMGPGGALEALVAARDSGRVRFIGVTGHGLVAPTMHAKSLDHFPFDSVLFPYNYVLAQDTEYLEDVDRLVQMCAERQVAVQIIKSIARRPWGERERTRDPWYEPLEEPEDVQRAVDFTFDLGDVFINTVSDLNVLPLVLDAAGKAGPRSSDAEMAEMALRMEMATIFEQRETV
jgi:aryl-alcohol dehydrogenase-like predicted oxidoreductase